MLTQSSLTQPSIRHSIKLLTGKVLTSFVGTATAGIYLTLPALAQAEFYPSVFTEAPYNRSQNLLVEQNQFSNRCVPGSMSSAMDEGNGMPLASGSVNQNPIASDNTLSSNATPERSSIYRISPSNVDSPNQSNLANSLNQPNPDMQFSNRPSVGTQYSNQPMIETPSTGINPVFQEEITPTGGTSGGFALRKYRELAFDYNVTPDSRANQTAIQTSADTPMSASRDLMDTRRDYLLERTNSQQPGAMSSEMSSELNSPARSSIYRISPSNPTVPGIQSGNAGVVCP